jgi:predicted DsbA family dithiol-disulfide isomerase
VGQVKEGKPRPQVELAYKERFAHDTIKEIDLSGSPSKGSPNAAVTIVEWADFECPACRAASPVLDQMVKANDDVRLVFKNFPLDAHENAESAARAAMAADKQGKFWPMHKALFASEAPLIDATLEQIAKDLALDLVQYKKDRRSESVADAVARDKKQAEEVKLAATPTIYINGRKFTSAKELALGLEEWVALERKLLPAQPKKAKAPEPKPTDDKPAADKPADKKAAPAPSPGKAAPKEAAPAPKEAAAKEGQ